jgi:hypothetical protein
LPTGAARPCGGSQQIADIKDYFRVSRFYAAALRLRCLVVQLTWFENVAELNRSNRPRPGVGGVELLAAH